MIVIGKFLSTHGLKGGVKLNSYCENPEDIFNLKLYTKEGNSVDCKKIGNTSKSDVFIVSINNIDTIENVELYKNQEIFVKKEELDDVDDDEIYVNDLIGMKVIANDLHGTVNNFYNYGGGDTIEVIWSNGDRDDIPFVEPYITKIDKKNLVIYIEKPTYI